MYVCMYWIMDNSIFIFFVILTQADAANENFAVNGTVLNYWKSFFIFPYMSTSDAIEEIP